MRQVLVAMVLGGLLIAGAAQAQYQGEGYYGQPAPADPNAGGTTYDPNAPGYGAPAYGQPPPPQQPPPPPPPEQQPGYSASASTDGASGDGEFRGFELGINWAGGAKVAIEPGYMFGKFGIYLLTGLGLSSEHHKISTDDAVLDAWGYPGLPGGVADPANAHHAGEGDWDEAATVNLTELTYDIGLAARFYLLEALRAQSPNLYFELSLGWRGAAVKNEVDWKFKGDEEALGDVNGDGAIDGQDAKDQATDLNKTWNRRAADYAHDAEQRLDGLWLNLGLGGEYVFVGGFGVAGEVGLSLFWNTPWTAKGPYGYDDDPDLAEFDWEYADVENRGWEVDFGFYYSLALRYHF